LLWAVSFGTNRPAIDRVDSHHKHYVYYWRRARFGKLNNAGFAILVGALAWTWWSKHVTDPEASTRLLTVVTALAAIATCYAAWITGRTLREMLEGRRSEIRPILWVFPKNPGWKERQGRDTRWFTVELNLANYGRGPAIAPRISVCIPYSHSSTSPGDLTMLHVPDLPPVIANGDSIDVNVQILVATYELPEEHPGIRSSGDFLEIRFAYEDAERNEYHGTKFFSLHEYGPLQKTVLHLKYDSLHFLPLSNRSAFVESDGSSYVHPDKVETLYSTAPDYWRERLMRRASSSNKQPPSET
jgi:hypothetical protein